MIFNKEVLLIVLLNLPKLLPTQKCTDGKDNVAGKSLFICSCESSCFHYGDCCANENEITFKPQLPIHTFQCVSRVKHQFLFNIADSNTSIKHDKVGFYLINKCPKSHTFESDTKNMNKVKCEKTNADIENIYSYQERLQYIVPTYHVEKGFIFKNKYCAKCHGYHKSLMQYPNGHVFCDSSANYTSVQERWELLKSEKCFMKFSFPTIVRAHQCYVGLQSDHCIANASMSLKRACSQSPTSYSLLNCQQKIHIYRNRGCAECNMNKECRIDRPRNDNLYSMYTLMYANDNANAFSFDSLIDFSSLMQKTNETNSTNSTFQTCNSILSTSQNKVMFIVTSSALSLSVIGLVALILVYSIIKELRNIGGMFVMNLSFSLLIGLVTFAITSIFAESLHTNVCLLVAFIKLLFFLSAFTWMVLFGFDLLQAFKRGGIPPKHRGSRTFLLIFMRASGFGYILPLIWTSAAFIVDKFASENSLLKPNFKNISACWFGSGPALIFWFFAPVTCAVFINLIILVVLVIFIYRATKQARFASKSKTQLRDTTLVALKITAVLGVTWIASLISELFLPADACWPKKIAGLLAALQGFFVACGFLVSRQIGRAIHKSRTGSSQSSSTITSKKHGHLQVNVKDYE